ncbi:T9SS type B sorting domain-containing protein [Dyadobacter pollutisoli]|uniref:Gliding motility-associated C-terminal domain-containing protein n=1 Tax=Dyadobacter pollutisoli TaxID=2910158 RepID=A0A9E8SQA1_9BACT|nr:gliding motility-associated C-terminal domain-containing protein [Dyadobacter pollutisoli]WAC12797.1 gliding motility-associated C-terminal domain-containing protein [Dyadobacter pollutisoli]
MKIKSLLLLLSFLFYLTNASGQTVRHTYRFYKDFAVAKPECGPDLIPSKALGICPIGASPGSFEQDVLPCGVRRDVYHNKLNWGFMYPNSEGAITDTYTIQMYIKVTDWGETWARIIDFSNGALDQGIYFKDNNGSTDRCLDFYPYGRAGACPFFNTSTYYLLTFTRNGQTGIMNVYVDNVLFATYNDSEGRYVGKAGTPIYIFRDDSSVACESGEANFAYLSFTNQYYGQKEVEKAFSEVCFVANINSYADFSISPNPSCGFPKDIDIKYTGSIPLPGTGYKFEWVFDGGKIVSGSGVGPYVVNWDTGGTKNVTLTVTGIGCDNPLTNRKQATISNLNLATAVESGSCETGKDGTLTLTATDGLPPYQYSIDSVNYQTDNIFKVPAASYKVYVKDGNNCTVGKPVNVVFNSDIVVNTIADTTICEGQTVGLNATGNAQNFLWSPQAGLNDATVKDPAATPEASTQYIVTAVRGFCSQSDTVNIDVAPKIEVMVTPDAVVEANVPYQLAASSPQVPDMRDAMFIWSPAIGLNNPASPSPIATLQSDQSYTVEITSGMGCKGTGNVNLSVKRHESINVPSAFTPDGDGKNDILVPLINEIVSISYFKIFNRWGQVVFFTDQLNSGWDGWFQNKNPITGIYVWEIEGKSQKGTTIRKKGSVALIK